MCKWILSFSMTISLLVNDRIQNGLLGLKERWSNFGRQITYKKTYRLNGIYVQVKFNWTDRFCFQVINNKLSKKKQPPKNYNWSFLVAVVVCLFEFGIVNARGWHTIANAAGGKFENEWVKNYITPIPLQKILKIGTWIPHISDWT